MKSSYYEGNRTFSVQSSNPVAPGVGEVRLDVAYCGICGTDLHIFHGAMDQRVDFPQSIGHEASATVAEIGEGVHGFEVGDPVVVRPLDNRLETEADRGYSHICKDLKFIGIDSPGAFQNSWTVPAFALHKIPVGTDLKLAALTEPLAVACHDVRIGEVQSGEMVVVLGGGPIGILIALVAKARGARVVLSELNRTRIEFAQSVGIEAVNPLETNLAELCQRMTSGRGADVVFEVSGAKAAALSMTELLSIRGRMVVVAIYPTPTEIDLFQFFWKELQLRGARVYEKEDYEEAISLIASGALPIGKMITDVVPLEGIQRAFDSLASSQNAMKVLIDCRK